MKDFLEFIQPDEGYVEVRSIRAPKEVRQHFTGDRADAMSVAMELNAEGWDAYYGVLPRTQPQGTADAVWHTSDVLWADLDAKGETTKGSALQSLIDYEITPSVIIDSGHGYHAYWKLTQPIPTLRACHIMKGLAKQLKGDHVYDAARILRLPGTTNYKRINEPVPVRLLRFDTTRLMRRGDFEHAERLADTMERRDSVSRVAVTYVPPANRPANPEWLDQLIRDGAPQGTRSEQCFKVMAHLAKRGWNDSEILATFESSGIGEKYREMSEYSGRRWFDRSLARAKR